MRHSTCHRSDQHRQDQRSNRTVRRYSMCSRYKISGRLPRPRSFFLFFSGMGPSVATIIATAALSAVFFQALVTWAPDTVPTLTNAPSNSKLAAISVDPDIQPPSMTLKTLAHATKVTSVQPSSTDAATTSEPSSSGFVPHESRADVPSGWVKTGSAHNSTKLNMRIALFSSGIEALKDILRSISSPSSNEYRQYLTSAQVSTFWGMLAASDCMI
jgi:hypothetical protein